ncbi:hypothetical protein GCM10009544_45100 [Streptomyces stramineus]|uniref:Integrase n=1 Tax=Streptomyces stramineus TaxID=173861 RepID=A0ABN1AJI2_9ACTN
MPGGSMITKSVRKSEPKTAMSNTVRALREWCEQERSARRAGADARACGQECPGPGPRRYGTGHGHGPGWGEGQPPAPGTGNAPVARRVISP